MKPQGFCTTYILDKCERIYHLEQLVNHLKLSLSFGLRFIENSSITRCVVTEIHIHLTGLRKPSTRIIFYLGLKQYSAWSHNTSEYVSSTKKSAIFVWHKSNAISFEVLDVLRLSINIVCFSSFCQRTVASRHCHLISLYSKASFHLIWNSFHYHQSIYLNFYGVFETSHALFGLFANAANGFFINKIFCCFKKTVFT